jgi:acetyl esterase/lipase
VFIKELEPDAPDFAVTKPQTKVLPQSLPLWGKGTPAHAFPRDDKEQVRSYKAQPGSLSGMNRAFSAVSMPTYSIHRPEKPNGVGLVICPGGGFRDVWIDREGHDLALWLKDHNVTSLVLKYRMRPADLSGPNAWQDYRRVVLADGTQAIRILRTQAKNLGLQPDKIGICGFSAGGYLAISCALQGEVKSEGQISGMPDFTALFYPGIPDQAPQWIERDKEIGPMFIVNARVDKLTPAEKCVDFYASLLRAGINAELHVFSRGSHGFGMGQGRGESVAMWPASFVAWLRDANITVD